jgi:hypothetical protein
MGNSSGCLVGATRERYGRRRQIAKEEIVEIRLISSHVYLLEIADRECIDAVAV